MVNHKELYATLIHVYVSRGMLAVQGRRNELPTRDERSFCRALCDVINRHNSSGSRYMGHVPDAVYGETLSLRKERRRVARGIA